MADNSISIYKWGHQPGLFVLRRTLERICSTKLYVGSKVDSHFRRTPQSGHLIIKGANGLYIAWSLALYRTFSSSRFVLFAPAYYSFKIIEVRHIYSSSITDRRGADCRRASPCWNDEPQCHGPFVGPKGKGRTDAQSSCSPASALAMELPPCFNQYLIYHFPPYSTLMVFGRCPGKSLLVLPLAWLVVLGVLWVRLLSS